MSADQLYSAILSICQDTENTIANDVHNRVTALSDSIMSVWAAGAAILLLAAYVFGEWKKTMKTEMNEMRVKIRDLERAARDLQSKTDRSVIRSNYLEDKVKENKSFVEKLSEETEKMDLDLSRATINLASETEQRVDLDARVFTLGKQVDKLEQFKDALQKTMGSAFFIAPEASDTDSSTSETERESDK